MLNKRLLDLLPDVGTRTAKVVFIEWLSLICSIAVTVCICFFINRCFLEKSIGIAFSARILAVIAVCVVLRAFFIKLYSEKSAETARTVKKILRERIFNRLCEIGVSYTKNISTAEAVQVSVDGIDQLEAYFSQYLPQLFYSLASTLTIFIFLCFISVKAAVILLICVPVIPLSIMGVQQIAKKLLSKYWDSYTTLGDSFLENIQGLTTLKIYQTDGIKHEEMNKNAEAFRRATMRVLIMQLNSISIMDIIAYGGAAIGMIAAISELMKGNITFFRAMVTVLLSAEFFIPLRQLGSFFHVAMNGAAAADKIFRILDMEVHSVSAPQDVLKTNIRLQNVSFAYDKEHTVLHNISFTLPDRGLFALSGKSGCGKSTAAGILTGRLRNYSGSVLIGESELSTVSERTLLDTITLVSHNSHIFKGTVRYNLAIGNINASNGEMQDILQKVRLWDFLNTENGLDTEIAEQGSNLSGGQRQRLALARALLRDTPVYIFDEAASNIDAESENAINDVIAELSKKKLVIIISHRLANTVNADGIFVLKDGRLVEEGTHTELMKKNAHYAELFTSQQRLEQYISGGDCNE